MRTFIVVSVVVSSNGITYRNNEVLHEKYCMNLCIGTVNSVLTIKSFEKVVKATTVYQFYPIL